MTCPNTPKSPESLPPDVTGLFNPKPKSDTKRAASLLALMVGLTGMSMDEMFAECEQVAEDLGRSPRSKAE